MAKAKTIKKVANTVAPEELTTEEVTTEQKNTVKEQKQNMSMKEVVELIANNYDENKPFGPRIRKLLAEAASKMD